MAGSMASAAGIAQSAPAGGTAEFAPAADVIGPIGQRRRRLDLRDARHDNRRGRGNRRYERLGRNAFARSEVNTIVGSRAGVDGVVVAFAEQAIVAAVAEEPIAARIGFAGVRSVVAVEIVDGVVVESGGDRVAV